MAFPTGWARKQAITIQSSQVGSGGVTDFDMLITRDHLDDEVVSPTDGNARKRGPTIGELAAIHHFGNPSRNLPARKMLDAPNRSGIRRMGVQLRRVRDDYRRRFGGG